MSQFNRGLGKNDLARLVEDFNQKLSGADGIPTSRITQVFGSGGPRAFQLALRVSF